MKKTLLLFRSSRAPVTLRDQRRRAARAFSLVEVTLALGIVTFVLVAIVGVMPAAMTSGRQSFDQNRAAAIADTLFSSFRSQPFNNVCYTDDQFQDNGATATSTSGMNLNTLNSATDPTDLVEFYASFLDPRTTDSTNTDAFGEQRRLCFTSYSDNAGIQQRAAAANYFVILMFNNTPAGMSVQPSTTVPAQANQVRIIVLPLSQGGVTRNSLKLLNQYLTATSDSARQAIAQQIPQLVPLVGKFTFTSTIANRQ